MHHLISLKMTHLTCIEMLGQWKKQQPNFTETLRLLEIDWPHAMTTVYCLADFLTDALLVDGHRLFDVSLSNAVMRYQNVNREKDLVRLWHFIDALTSTAASALTGIRLVDPDHFEWAAVDGVYLHTWFRNRPTRLDYLAKARIDVRHVTSHTHTKRVQQVIKTRLMTQAVATLVAQIEKRDLHAKA